MRKLVFILIAFIAAVTFIRAFDNKDTITSVLPQDLTGEVLNFEPELAGSQH